ncbi:hypothetical protein Thermo_00003 [Thermoplasmatales archaeon]|nr:hypothetical protein Thermo_00003 [Thermoplasmatales archaeon]
MSQLLQGSGSAKSKYVSASEISQYEFCNVAWYYQKEGYPRSKISSRRMASGRESHKKVEKSYVSLTLIVRILVIALVLVIAALALLSF